MSFSLSYKYEDRFWSSNLRSNFSIEWSALESLTASLLTIEEKTAIDNLEITDQFMEILNNAIRSSQFEELVEFLKINKIGLNFYDGDGYTPLHTVAKSGNHACLHVLLQHGADCNIIELRHGHSVLHVAAMHGQAGCVSTLIIACANILYTNSLSSGRCALHYAAEAGSAACIRELTQIKEHNLMKGNDRKKDISYTVTIQDIDGLTPLHLACVDGNLQCVQLLLDAGSDVNLTDKQGRTAAMIAQEMHHNAVLQLFQSQASSSSASSFLRFPLFRRTQSAGSSSGYKDSFPIDISGNTTTSSANAATYSSNDAASDIHHIHTTSTAVAAAIGGGVSDSYITPSGDVSSLGVDAAEFWVLLRRRGPSALGSTWNSGLNHKYEFILSGNHSHTVPVFENREIAETYGKLIIEQELKAELTRKATEDHKNGEVSALRGASINNNMGVFAKNTKRLSVYGSGSGAAWGSGTGASFGAGASASSGTEGGKGRSNSSGSDTSNNAKDILNDNSSHSGVSSVPSFHSSMGPGAAGMTPTSNVTGATGGGYSTSSVGSTTAAARGEEPLREAITARFVTAKIASQRFVEFIRAVPYFQADGLVAGLPDGIAAVSAATLSSVSAGTAGGAGDRGVLSNSSNNIVALLATAAENEDDDPQLAQYKTAQIEASRTAATAAATAAGAGNGKKPAVPPSPQRTRGGTLNEEKALLKEIELKREQIAKLKQKIAATKQVLEAKSAMQWK